MARILVAGGRGALGREIVTSLKPSDHHIRILSRQPAPATAEADPRIEWAQADLATGDGVPQSVQDVDTIVNCVSDPFGRTYQTDIVGTRQFLRQARQAGVQHVVHISIVGIDHVHSPYYRIKRESEQVVIDSGIGWTISRITQFHTLLDLFMQRLSAVPIPVLLLPLRWQFQLIATRDVARYLLPVILSAPSGRLPDLGGPEVLPMRQIVQAWMRARGDRRPVLPFQPLGKWLFKEASDGFSQGQNLTPSSRYGTITWADYVRERYGSQEEGTR